MSAHTPGPWCTNGGAVETDRPRRSSQLVAHVYGEESGLESEQLANARLIAAAPDLLEALEGLLRLEACDSDEPIGREAWATARAAIAKATGGITCRPWRSSAPSSSSTWRRRGQW